MNQLTNPAGEQVQPRARLRLWHLLVAAILAIFSFFAVLGIVSVVGRWHPIADLPKPDNAEIERSGSAPWAVKERKSDLRRRIDTIDKEIPAIEGELDFLDKAMQREKMRAHKQPESRFYIDFILREQNFLHARIDDLRTDRAYYSHELQEQ
jgi:hypothetical protein